MDGKRINFSLDAAQRADAREAIRILQAAGWSVENPLSVAAQIAVGRGAVHERTLLMVAADRFLKDCLRRKLRKRSVDFYESKLNPFLLDHSDAYLDDFDRPAVRAWLMGLGVSDATRAGYLRALGAFWGFCMAQDPPLCRANPTDGLKLAVVMVEREVALFSVGEVERILANAGDYTAAVVLMLFAGVRPGEIRMREKLPMVWGDIDFKARSIRIGGATAKTRVARVLEGLPPVLWEWLRALRVEDKAKPICKYQLKYLPRYLRGVWEANKWGELRWPQDACRHSFATYHIAAFKSVEKTSLILGHEGKARLLHQRYRGLATSDQARKFFEIKPILISNG